jgi:hypothetical protein
MDNIVTDYFIHPELGNYKLPADRILRNLIEETGLNRTNVTIQELGLNDFMVTPGVNNDKTAICRSYSAQVTLTCGYAKIAEVLAHIQESNPYIAITSLTIDDIESDKRKHQIGFQVQWPTWRSIEIQTTMETDYKAALATMPKKEEPVSESTDVSPESAPASTDAAPDTASPEQKEPVEGAAP